MKQARVAKRYAQALFNTAVENKLLDLVESDLKVLDEEYHNIAEIREVMDSPVIPKHTKQNMFEKVYKNRLQAITFNFVIFLILKNREAAIAEVITNFRKLLDDHRGIIRGEVSSVMALSDSQMKNLKAHLDRITGKNVIIIQRVDTRLLGGFVVQIEDKVYDTSLRHQLEMMRQNLVES